MVFHEVHPYEKNGRISSEAAQYDFPSQLSSFTDRNGASGHTLMCLRGQLHHAGDKDPFKPLLSGCGSKDLTEDT